jgi:hypothetical protein
MPVRAPARLFLPWLLLLALATAGPALARPAAPADATPMVEPYGSALPDFALFGWVGPPRDSTNLERYGELAAAGFNVVMFALGEQGTWADNRARLDCSRPFGLLNVMLDNELDSLYVDRPETMAFADTIVARYKDDPAFLGYYLGDEPYPDMFPRLGEWFSILRPRDPAHPAWNSLRPRGGFASQADFVAYLEDFVAAARPAVVCNNQYDFRLAGDSHYLVENVAAMGQVARGHRIPFWGIVQLIEHWVFRTVTDGMLRWEVAQWLAGGASGIGYFTYWTPPPEPDYHWGLGMIEWDSGARTPYYDMVATLNAKVAPIGQTLAGLRFVATRFAGSLPRGGTAFTPDSVLAAVSGRATMGWFTDGERQTYLFIANADSASAQTLWLTSADGRAPSRLTDDGSDWLPLAVDRSGRFALPFAPGDFALLRFPVRAEAIPLDVGGGPPLCPALRVTPNPAFGRVRLELAAIPDDATLSIVDAAGRAVWSRPLPRGTTSATWSGARADGGRAERGMYFACLRTRSGTLVRRLAWLGAR